MIKRFESFENYNEKETEKEIIRKLIPSKIWNELVRYQKDFIMEKNTGDSELREFIIYANDFLNINEDTFKYWSKKISKYKTLESLNFDMRDMLFTHLVKSR